MSAFINNIGILASQNQALPYLLIYVATIFVGNISVFIAFWLMFKGYFAAWGILFLFLTIFAADVTGDVSWYSLGNKLRDTRLGNFIRNHLPRHEKIESHLRENGDRWIFISKFIYFSSFTILFLVGWFRFGLKKMLRVSIPSICISLAVIFGVAYGLFAGISLLEATAVFKRFERLLLLGVVLFIVANYFLSRLFKKIFKANGTDGQ
jgi:membrane protein DedA with SNARE-associated domain